MQRRSLPVILLLSIAAAPAPGADRTLRASPEAGTACVREILGSQPARRSTKPAPALAAEPALEQALSGRMSALEALIRQDPRGAAICC